MTNRGSLIRLLEEDAQVVNKNVDLSALEGKSVTISGSTGLVGINIIFSLTYHNKNSGKNLIKINALSFNKPETHIYDFFKENNIDSFYGDLNDHAFITSIPSSDFIIHSAGYGQPGRFLEDKINTISINTSATINLSSKLNVGGSFLFLSSAEVYSGSTNNKNIESEIGTTNPNHARACYIEGKRSGEAIVNALRENGINAVSARLALAYGPGIKLGDTRVINQLIQKGLEGEIKLLDSGKAIRTYCYISDATSMLLKLLLKNKEPVYNVGGKSVISIKDLALKIGGLLDVPVIIPRSESYLDDAPKTVGLDLSLIEEEYGFNNFIDIREGLDKTIQWIKESNE